MPISVYRKVQQPYRLNQRQSLVTLQIMTCISPTTLDTRRSRAWYNEMSAVMKAMAGEMSSDEALGNEMLSIEIFGYLLELYLFLMYQIQRL